MRAAIMRNTGDHDLEVRDDITLRPTGPGEVKVRITHSGVCPVTRRVRAQPVLRRKPGPPLPPSPGPWFFGPPPL